MKDWFYNRYVEVYNRYVEVYNFYITLRNWCVERWNKDATEEPEENIIPTELYNQQINEYNRHVNDEYNPQVDSENRGK